MPSQHRFRRTLLAALVLTSSIALAGCSAAADDSDDSAVRTQEQAEQLRAELEAFILPGGDPALEPSGLSGVEAGAGYHAETLFSSRGAESETIVAEAAAALEAAGLTRVAELPDGSQVPADAGALSTGYWGGGDWVIGAQAGVRLDEDGVPSDDLVLQYVFLVAAGAESSAAEE